MCGYERNKILHPSLYGRNSNLLLTQRISGSLFSFKTCKYQNSQTLFVSDTRTSRLIPSVCTRFHWPKCLCDGRRRHVCDELRRKNSYTVIYVNFGIVRIFAFRSGEDEMWRTGIIVVKWFALSRQTVPIAFQGPVRFWGLNTRVRMGQWIPTWGCPPQRRMNTQLEGRKQSSRITFFIFLIIYNHK